MADTPDFDKEIRQALDDSGDLLDKLFHTTDNKDERLSGDEKDAQISITVREGGMEATVCVYSPAPDGADVTFEQLKEAVEQKGIVYGVDWDLLENIANEKLYDAIFIFAQGDPKEDGKNGTVTPRYDEVRKLKPKLLEDGTVDFRNLGAVVNIRMGDPICDIEEATAGVDGTDIFGNELKAVPGTPAQVPMGQNTAINGDGTLLIAQKDGNLRYDNGKFLVDTEFVVKGDVDVSTGNIHFIGNVIIKGNVETGFTVESEKSITIEGMVNGVHLRAKEDITVRNGVINSEVTSEEGSVKMGFAENSHICGKHGVKAASMVSCTVECEGDVDCTLNPGTIVGGSYSIFGNMHCTTLGHKSYIPTSVELGCIKRLNQEMNSLNQQIKKINGEIDKLDAAIKLLKDLKEKGITLDAAKEQFINAAVRMKVQKAREKKPLLERTQELDAYTSDINKLSIQVNKALYPNVKIAIGGATITNRSEYGKCVVRNNGDEIVIS